MTIFVIYSKCKIIKIRMHKLFVIKGLYLGDFKLKKILKNKNIYSKFVNNHKTIIYHKKLDKYHMLSKGYGKYLDLLTPIYQNCEKEYDAIDLIDLENYERWLNV